ATAAGRPPARAPSPTARPGSTAAKVPTRPTAPTTWRSSVRAPTRRVTEGTPGAAPAGAAPGSTRRTDTIPPWNQHRATAARVSAGGNHDRQAVGGERGARVRGAGGAG